MKHDSVIVSAAIVGYTRLMRLDATGMRQVVEEIDEQLVRGRLEALSGNELRRLDGRTVILFPGVGQALRFVIGLQLGLEEQNRNRRRDRRVEFLIGMELMRGADEKDQAETVALQLMEMAEPGGICLSGAVRTALPASAELSVEQLDTGIIHVVADAVGAYELDLDESARRFVDSPLAPSSRKRGRVISALGLGLASLLIVAGLAYFLWPRDGRPPMVASPAQAPFDRPSIAVLPFSNLSQIDKGAMIAHGLTISITSALAEVPQLAVISSNAAYRRAGDFNDPLDAGHHLGVGYVLSGSVQVQNDQVRVIAELENTKTGQSIWSQRFDETQASVFSIQDDVTLQVLISLQVTLVDGQRARDLSAGTSNVDAYLGLLRAEQAYRQFTRDSMVQARDILKNVLELDPDYYQALVLKAQTYTYDAQMGYGGDSVSLLNEARKLLEQAAALDGSVSDAEKAGVIAANAYRDQIARKFDAAVSLALAAANSGPNNSDVQALAGWVLSYNRDYQRSTNLMLNAVALDPAFPSWYANYLSRNATFSGDYEEAVRWANTGVARAENDRRRAWSLFSLVFAYVEAGDMDAARKAATDARRAWPGIELDVLKRAQPFQYDADWERFAAAMKTAGVVEDASNR